MEQEIKFGKKIFIRSAGKNEYWLQDVIYANPEKLGLGDLVVVRREKNQSSNGRLDLLLKDPKDDTMYEVEVMLGETDPSHIIRTIEYWDNEKRKYPQRQHYAVLVAESFDRRYFNVIQLLSLSVPMIAIQADLLEIGDDRVLNFSKILDVYIEQQEEDEETKQVTESSWKDYAPWVLENAKKHLEILAESEPNIDLKFTQSYICIIINGKNHYYYNKRAKPNSGVWFRVKEEEKVDLIKKLFEEYKITYDYITKSKDFWLIYDNQFLARHADLLRKIHQIRVKEFTPEE